MIRSVKRLFCLVSKALGLFYLSRLLTKNGLRILCYHGLALTDESEFRPGLFLRPEKFERRMQFLSENNFPVLSLDEAMERLERNTLPPCATVITFDDGFYSVYAIAMETLKKHRFPATLYLASYYFLKGTPLYHYVVSYMFWKTSKKVVDLSEIGVPALVGTTVDLSNSKMRLRVEEIIKDYGVTACDEPTRCAITDKLGECLGVDYQEIVERRILSLINSQEAVEMEANGIDIQLHTHRHDFPNYYSGASRELSDNKAAIEPILGRRLHHFCYPYGIWSREHWKALRDAGVKTATTCDPGLVYRHTPKYALKRILDGSPFSQIEFEAKMYGHVEFVRYAKALLRGRLPG